MAEEQVRRCGEADVGSMTLYNLARADACMDRLRRHHDVESSAHEHHWSIEDTASFDCMHYLGNEAIENAARTLGLQANQTVFDLGSGYSATGRYLWQEYGVRTTGIELQPEIHARAQEITARCGFSEEQVRSICGDFLRVDNHDLYELSGAPPFDALVSFLCILHIPDRGAVFERARSILKPGGQVYIEDYYARAKLDETSSKILREEVACPYLPTRARYEDDLKAAGFLDVAWHDVSDEWTDFVVDRAQRYKTDPSHDAHLADFFDHVAGLFRSGAVGGVRLSARLPDSSSKA